MKSKSGFTIVELLIVIVVIAILAAISIVAYNGIQSRAKFTKVKQDFASIQKLLELYRIDNGDYPAVSGWAYSYSNADGFIPGLVPKYASSLPRFTADSAASAGNTYIYRSDGSYYKLMRLGQPTINSGEWSLVPSSMYDQNSTIYYDRYGVWSSNGQNT